MIWIIGLKRHISLNNFQRCGIIPIFYFKSHPTQTIMHINKTKRQLKQTTCIYVFFFGSLAYAIMTDFYIKISVFCTNQYRIVNVDIGWISSNNKL